MKTNKKNELGIILDSSSGMKKKYLEEKKWFYFLPIVINFDNKEYKSGVDIDNEFLYKYLVPGKKIKTAAVSPGDMELIFKKALEENEHVIYIPISRHISSTYSIAKVMAKELNIENKITIYPSNFITPWFQLTFSKIEEIINDQKSNKKNRIIEILDDVNKHMFAFLIPDTLDFLYSGGRLSKIQYLTGNLLKIIPIIVFKNGSINKDDVIKTRTLKKSYTKVINEVTKIRKKFENENKNIKIGVTNINSNENFNLLLNLLTDSDIKSEDIIKVDLSCEIISHIGPNAVGIGLFINSGKHKHSIIDIDDINEIK